MKDHGGTWSGEDSCLEWGWSWKTSYGQESPDREGWGLFYKRGRALAELLL